MSSQRQRQKEKRKQRSLHDKHRMRRKKDLMVGMPFIIGYQGDPAMGNRFYCNDIRSFKLIVPNKFDKPFARLYRYQMKAIASILMFDMKILVKEAS